MSQERTARHKRRVGRGSIITAALVAAVGGVVGVVPPVVFRGSPSDAVTGGAGGRASLERAFRVMTLNLAHGRAEGTHQLLTSRDRIVANLDDVARVVRLAAPDLVALQEADGPSAWSGGFDHVAYLAQRAELPRFARGAHVVAPRTTYGTALIANTALRGARSVPLPLSIPTPSKGYVLAQIQVDGTPVDVVSVHLDFARASAREDQVDALIADLSKRSAPCVLMGDLNTGWGPTIERLAAALDLHTWEPDAPAVTFPTRSARLDWVLVSAELAIRSHAVLPDPVSDHRAVVADLELLQ